MTTTEVRQLINLPTQLTTDEFLKRQGFVLDYEDVGIERDIYSVCHCAEDNSGAEVRSIRSQWPAVAHKRMWQLLSMVLQTNS